MKKLFLRKFISVRVDGRFNPTEKMTRKDAAMILSKLFNKVW